MARLANIVPRSRQCFDPARNLTRGDVVTNQHGLIVTFKGAVSRGFCSRFVKTSLKLRLNAFTRHTKCSWNIKREISSEFLQGEQTIRSFQ